MSNRQAWVGGVSPGLTWASAGFTTGQCDSVGNGTFVLASGAAIDNSSNLDLYSDISIQLASITTVAPNRIDWYLMPLNSDGTTYGDGTANGSSTAPASTYFVGSVVVILGTATPLGTLRGIVLIPGKWKFGFYNNLGVGTAASGNTLPQYRTYSEQNNAP